MNNPITDLILEGFIPLKEKCPGEFCVGRELVFIRLKTERQFQYLPDFVGWVCCTQCGSIFEHEFNEDTREIRVVVRVVEGRALLTQVPTRPDYVARLLDW